MMAAPEKDIWKIRDEELIKWWLIRDEFSEFINYGQGDYTLEDILLAFTQALQRLDDIARREDKS